MRLQFNANAKMIARVQGTYSIAELEREQGVYAATPEFVRKHAGAIANSILDKIPEQYFDEAKKRGLYPNVDVRVHRLYPGNYPAYPGWHCDAQYRETYFSQPKPQHTAVSEHLVCTVSSAEGGVSHTRFLDEPEGIEIELDHGAGTPEDGTAFWTRVDEQVRAEEPKEREVPDGDLTRFDCWTLHRCTPARIRGWRLFFRMAMWYRPHLGEGQISRQEMIYVSGEGGTGW